MQQSSLIWSHRALPFSFFYFFLCQSTPTAVRHGNLIAIFWPIYLFLIPFTEEGGLFKHAHAALPKILSTLLPKTNLWICWIKISDHYASQNLSGCDQNDHRCVLLCFSFGSFVFENWLKIEWKLNKNWMAMKYQLGAVHKLRKQDFADFWPPSPPRKQA